MKEQKKKTRVLFIALLCFVLLFCSVVTVNAGTITASDHWILKPIYDLDYMYYSGAEGYTTSKSNHRTSIQYLICGKSTKVVRKWGTGKVYAKTGYVRNHKCNLKNAFTSNAYYEF